ncbi:MAG TPA: aldo/keto reductase, partial [Burkholderiaceae bacterium]|nr:aldo/keto reductase [Burkholderiaceae bacterium]
SDADLGKSARGGAIERYLTPRGMQILDALDEVAETHNATPAEVALAWLMARPGVTAPIASATRIQQLDSLIRSSQLALTDRDLSRLDQASEG